MSLFGTSPDDSSTTNVKTNSHSKSLFDEQETPGIASGASLFTDGGDATGDSPWNLPTPKKAAKSDLVKNLLAKANIPDTYIDAFDTILDSGDRLGAGISIDGARKLLESSRVDANEQSRLLKLVVPAGLENAELGRNEFNVLLALVGLSQENEEATLDGVDERREHLPEPKLPYLKKLKSAKVSETLVESPSSQRTPTLSRGNSRSAPSPQKSRRTAQESLDDIENDPWASPAVHKGHTHPVKNEETPKSTGITAAKPLINGQFGPSRTTSSFTTHIGQPDTGSSDPSGRPPLSDAPSSTSVGGWGSYDNQSTGFATEDRSSAPGPSDFGSGGDNPEGSRSRPSRSFGGGRSVSHGVDETVTITTLPEKEGIFMFQHRNYEVKSARRASTVIRRYSDFVWLLDCLHRRYPFRQLPLLPPKRVGVNGNHLSSENLAFIEKRRRGLVRFTNALVRHPVLSQEQLVVMFLTVPTELAVWRKQATISVQEEFTGKALPPGLEDSLPTNLSETFGVVRAGVKRSTEAYINLCNLLERLSKRSLGVAADYLRFSIALKSLTEVTEDTYATDTNDVPLLNEGIQSTAKHLETSQSLLEDESRAWDEGVLEDFKRQRDSLTSVRDMFDRRDRYARDNIHHLERRIESNEAKLAGITARGQNAVKPGEQEKVEQAIMIDKQSIVNQHARGVLIKECIRDELVFFQQSQFHVSKLHQDWSQERVKYAELQADNWRALSEEVDNMPSAE